MRLVMWWSACAGISTRESWRVLRIPYPPAYGMCNTDLGIRSMKTLVIGLGNPILTDDGVGVKAVPTQHSASAHDMNLPTAMELGRQLGLALPQIIEIFAIEAEDVVTFGETCTPSVDAAIPFVTELVLRTLT